MTFRTTLWAAALTLAAWGCDRAPDAAPGAAAPRAAVRAEDPNVYRVPLEDSAVNGSAAALVTLVEFSDYQCPFCSRANATVKQLQTEYGEKLRVVMKHNPLPSHPRAMPAAQAVLAAQRQDKFWPLHEKLFENNKALEDGDLERYAEQAGLNVAKFKEDLALPSSREAIARDQALAQKLGATGTPAFFINGRKLTGAQPIDHFRALIDEELAKAQQQVKDGTPAEKVYAQLQEKAIEGKPQAAAAPAGAAPGLEVVRKIENPVWAPVKGGRDAKVTIVEWSDFQCPFCSRVGPTMRKIEETYGNKVRVVFRHQPLPFHANAKPAAAASMAAGEQGQFWQMHDKLFANQGALERPALERYAEELHLDLAKFRAALDGDKFDKQIAEDQEEGTRLGANGTPTFFINGRQLVGAQPYERFAALIDEELKK